MRIKELGLIGVVAVLLVGCSEPASNQLTVAEVKGLDQQLLPNDNWQLSRATIELSFCRDRVNEALLASEAELRGWRLTGEPTAFPPYRSTGLEALAEVRAQTNVLLWQRQGNVSAQRYAVVNPASASRGAVADSVFPALVKLSSLPQICHAAVDDSDS